MKQHPWRWLIAVVLCCAGVAAYPFSHTVSLVAFCLGCSIAGVALGKMAKGE